MNEKYAMNNTEPAYYFCMVCVGPREHKTNEMVHCTGDTRPYVTLSRDGLALTRHHASMYRYIPGSNIARYVPDVRRMGLLRSDVTLRPDQVEALNKAIATQYFFS